MAKFRKKPVVVEAEKCAACEFTKYVPSMACATHGHLAKFKATYKPVKE